MPIPVTRTLQQVDADLQQVDEDLTSVEQQVVKLIHRVNVPRPPTRGAFTLKSIDGYLKWVAG